MSDWGIEESTQPNSKANTSANGLMLSPSITSTSTSTTTRGPHNDHTLFHQPYDDFFALPQPQPSFLHNRQYNQQSRKFSNISTSSQQQQQMNYVPDFQYYYHTYVDDPLSPTTENFSLFIQKYLSLENKLNEFWEKFKYNLILSNLLEDSMVLSKNETNLQTLSQTSLSNYSELYTYSINNDGTKLYILDKHYELCYNLKYNNTKIIILVINMIIFLLKQQQLYHNQIGNSISLELQFKMFKIILYMAMKIIKVKKFKTIIHSNQILTNLQSFLMLNYKINKKLILNLINLKGDQLNLTSRNIFKEMKNHTLNSLNFLNINLQCSIVELLPFVNGDLFEQYCTINNINLDILNNSSLISQDGDDDGENSLQEVVYNINKFDNLRKLFICQLLTINETSKPNFFVYKLMDDFQIDDYQQSGRMSDISRLVLLKDVLSNHNSTLSNINGLFEKFEKLNKTNMSDGIDNDPSPSSSLSPPSNLDNLISRITNLSTHLKYFQKYSYSIKNLDNVDEQQEKLMIFNQFKDELEHIKTLYKSSYFDLNRELNPNYMVPQSPSNASSTSSPPNSTSFNLKSFHNSSLKKRFSLPPQQSPASTPTTPPPPTSVSANNGNNKKDKKYKRLSTGLQLGLLTVFENEQQQFDKSRNRISNGSSHSRSSSKTQNHVVPVTSYDDNYLNILPPANYETYNQKALEALSKKGIRNTNSNRYSLNSVKSNISGITDLISTNMTSYGGEEEEDDGQDGERKSYQHPLSKEDLKLKLEESFNRIYNLENENKLLKKSLTRSDEQQEEEETIGKLPDAGFLSELEAKLNK
ncbi:hypothetical protein SBY92_003895 [Candida maltosa Xu316]